MRWHLKSIFNDDGTVWGYDERKYDSAPLEDYFASMPEGEDKENFLQFLWKMMRVDPEDRSSAEELLKELWLQDIVLDGDDDAPPTPPPIYDVQQEEINEIVDQMDVDTTSACTEASTLTVPPVIETVARADIRMTDSPTNAFTQVEADCIPPSTKDQGSCQEKNDIPVAAVDISTEIPPENDPSSPKKRKLSHGKVKSNGANKKNKKRNRGGKR